MADDVAVYISILRDSLKEKYEVVKQILQATQRQRDILEASSVDADAFEEQLSIKDTLIAKMLELDTGFDRVFKKVDSFLKADPQSYKQQILEMQNYIRVITECSVKIQAIESKNKFKFEEFVRNKRKEIREFKTSNKTAVSYYQNMANQHHEWQTYFVDQKK